MKGWIKGSIVGLIYGVYCVVILAIIDYLSTIGTAANFILVTSIILSITAMPYIALKAAMTPLLGLFGLAGAWACKIICVMLLTVLFGAFAWMFTKARGTNKIKKNSIVKKASNLLSNNLK